MPMLGCILRSVINFITLVQGCVQGFGCFAIVFVVMCYFTNSVLRDNRKDFRLPPITVTSLSFFKKNNFNPLLFPLLLFGLSNLTFNSIESNTPFLVFCAVVSVHPVSSCGAAGGECCLHDSRKVVFSETRKRA